MLPCNILAPQYVQLPDDVDDVMRKVSVDSLSLDVHFTPLKKVGRGAIKILIFMNENSRSESERQAELSWVRGRERERQAHTQFMPGPRFMA